MATLTIRGYDIDVHAKTATQLRWYRRRYETYSDEQLAQIATIKKKVSRSERIKVFQQSLYAWEEELRGWLLDDIEECEEECRAQGYGFDDTCVAGDGTVYDIVYPENANDVLDDLICGVFELTMKLAEVRDDV